MTIKDEDFDTLAVCAVRYAIGRHTYMPSLVRNIILPNIPNMNTNALLPIARECRCPWYTVEIQDDWASFREIVEAELASRGIYE